MQSEAGENGEAFGLELRSVNSRFLDFVFKIPEGFKPHESRIRQILGEHVGRGKVELRLSQHRAQADQARHLNPLALQKLAAAQEVVQTWLPQARPLSVAEVLGLQSAQEAQVSEWAPEHEQLLLRAIEALKAARQAEGARLVAVLREKITQLRALADRAEPLVPELVEQQRRRFLERWEEAMGVARAGKAPMPERGELEQRALTEATAFAIRIDVAEELARLRAHLDEIEQLLGGKTRAARDGKDAKEAKEAKGKVASQPVGKRLDFLIQELHREANTLGSKSALLELSRISMDMKVLIEQMREQVQNIE